LLFKFIGWLLVVHLYHNKLHSPKGLRHVGRTVRAAFPNGSNWPCARSWPGSVLWRFASRACGFVPPCRHAGRYASTMQGSLETAASKQRARCFRSLIEIPVYGKLFFFPQQW